VRTRVDLVYCQEVVEHLEERYLDHLLDTLACGQFILMTHAIPGQGGHHHEHCREPDYWLEQLGKRGYVLQLADTQRIRKLAEKENCPYMASTGLLLARTPDFAGAIAKLGRSFH
jgi:hypothetical protein